MEVSRLDDMPMVTMLEDEEGNYHFKKLSVNKVNRNTNRATGETEMNQSSSRSHCIFTIMVEKRLNDSDSVIRSKSNLADLAVSIIGFVLFMKHALEWIASHVTVSKTHY